MLGKCPHCGKPILGRVNGQGVEVSMGFGMRSWKAVAYSCSLCHGVLGCEINPLDTTHDIVVPLSRKIESLESDVAQLRHELRATSRFA